MLKTDKNLVVVGDYSRAYYNTDGYEKLKRMIFEEDDNFYNADENLFFKNEEGEIVLNDELYNKLKIEDIDNDIQQVLIGDDIINNLVDDKPDDNGDYTCRVRINGGWDYVKIPYCFFDIIED